MSKVIFHWKNSIYLLYHAIWKGCLVTEINFCHKYETCLYLAFWRENSQNLLEGEPSFWKQRSKQGIFGNLKPTNSSISPQCENYWNSLFIFFYENSENQFSNEHKVCTLQCEKVRFLPKNQQFSVKSTFLLKKWSRFMVLFLTALMWKLHKFSLLTAHSVEKWKIHSHRAEKKFRQINYLEISLAKPLLSRYLPKLYESKFP